MIIIKSQQLYTILNLLLYIFYYLTKAYKQNIYFVSYNPLEEKSTWGVFRLQLQMGGVYFPYLEFQL